jgi:hypothetical protein
MAKRETAFPVAKWAPLDEAFVKAKAALGSWDLALLDLRGHLQSGRLPSALRWFERDGTEGSEKLKAAFWTVTPLQEKYEDIEPDGSLRHSGKVWVSVSAAALATAQITIPNTATSLWFFVSRRHLDKLYAVAAPIDDEVAPIRAKPKPRKKQGPGRDPTFKPEQQAALQWEYRSYKRKNPGAFKKVARDHLQTRAKTKFKIEASSGTITKHIMKPVDDDADAKK